MRQILALAFKDLTILSRDRAGLFFIVGFPVLLGLFFGLVYQGMGDSDSMQLNFAISDEDNSATSREFATELSRLAGVDAQLVDAETARKKIRGGQLVALVTIPSGFGESAGAFWGGPPKLKLEQDPSRKAEASVLAGKIMQAMGHLLQTRMNDTQRMKESIQKQRSDLDQLPAGERILIDAILTNADSLFDRIDRLSAANPNAPNADGPNFELVSLETIDAFQKRQGVASQLRSGWDLSLPSAALWGVMSCAAGFAMSLVREKSRGTLLRLRVSPLKAWHLILGKTVACYLAILFVFGLVIGLGYLLGMRAKSPLLLAASGTVVGFCFVGIMMAMSTLGKTEEAVGGLGWMVNMVMAMFGGAMIPLAFMPGIMKPLSHLSPVKWAILSLEGAIWRGFSTTDFLLPWTILLVIGCASLAVGIVGFQRNYQQ